VVQRLEGAVRRQAALVRTPLPELRERCHRRTTTIDCGS
jgi:hypothetical protein